MKKLYYAHCVGIYGTPQEERDMELLREMFPDWEVVNPNCIEFSKGYEERGMEFFQDLVLAYDACAFRALPDGAVPSGVATEVIWFRQQKKPVIELPSAFTRRVMTLEQTREYLREVGQR